MHSQIQKVCTVFAFDLFVFQKNLNCNSAPNNNENYFKEIIINIPTKKSSNCAKA